MFGQRQIKQLGLKSRAGWLNLITHRHFLNFLFGLTCLLIIGANFLNSNQVKAQDYGQQSLIYSIIGQNSELIEDTTAPNVSLPADGSDLALSGEGEEETEESTEDTMMLNSGGLVKLDIVSPEELQRSRTTQYVIQTGDTLYSIAQKFQISVNTILWANNLTLRTSLKPGTKLLILPTTGVAHKVKRGDTLNSIAKQYGTTKEKIESFNHIVDGSLVIGEIIIIPDGKIIYQAPTPTKVVSKPTTSPKPASTNYPTQVTGTGEMVWPTACRRITQYFRGRLHTGVDIACGMGVPLYAADSGTVVSVIYGRTGYGYHIIINHGNGKYTLYGHASKIYVEPGETVERGQLIAAMGSTGRSTGPHLHFEVRLNGPQGTRVNPLPYIR